jgi:hypothetical protein
VQALWHGPWLGFISIRIRSHVDPESRENGKTRPALCTITLSEELKGSQEDYFPSPMT